MELKDVSQVTSKLDMFLEKFKFHRIFNEMEVEYWLTPRKDIVYSYVVEDPISKEITEFISFTSTPYSVNDKGSTDKSELKNAFCYYYFVSEESRLIQLLQDVMIMAKSLGFDTFNCRNQMNYGSAFDALGFRKTQDAGLQYHSFKQRPPKGFNTEELAILLL